MHQKIDLLAKVARFLNATRLRWFFFSFFCCRCSQRKKAKRSLKLNKERWHFFRLWKLHHRKKFVNSVTKASAIIRLPSVHFPQQIYCIIVSVLFIDRFFLFCSFHMSASSARLTIKWKFHYDLLDFRDLCDLSEESSKSRPTFTYILQWWGGLCWRHWPTNSLETTELNARDKLQFLMIIFISIRQKVDLHASAQSIPLLLLLLLPGLMHFSIHYPSRSCAMDELGKVGNWRNCHGNLSLLDNYLLFISKPRSFVVVDDDRKRDKQMKVPAC